MYKWPVVSGVGCYFFAFFPGAGGEETNERDGYFVPVCQRESFFELGRGKYVEVFVGY